MMTDDPWRQDLANAVGALEKIAKILGLEGPPLDDLVLAVAEVKIERDEARAWIKRTIPAIERSMILGKEPLPT